MSLTGTAFFYTLIIATLVAMAGTLVLWGRVRGPQWLRWVSRVAMIAACQLTAISVVAVWINNSNGLYTSWADLFGEQQPISVPVASADNGMNIQFAADRAGFQRAHFFGKASGLTGEALVWVPPQYNEPQYARYDFPVITLLSGYPGSPWSWIGGGGVPNSISGMMANGTLQPSILVIPEISPSGVNTDCTDVGVNKNATWLAKDVPSMIKNQFRVMNNPHAWGLVGYSTGGYCAPKLVLQYPTVFGSAVGMSPDDFHGDPTIVRDKKILAAQNPLAIAKKATNSDVSILIATTKSDRFSTPANAQLLYHTVKWPVQMPQPIVLNDGGHNWNTWKSLYPVVFPWLSQQLMAPQPAATPSPSPSPVIKADAVAKLDSTYALLTGRSQG
ncbi:alpha/beta hydrolase [Streptacidiphilus sp. MAP5-3]|uniref:alpha/beta hydrolase n=1 Tax=unclassified Streptacidiphilus TaxID=2643834 RepID=UPI0035173EBF